MGASRQKFLVEDTTSGFILETTLASSSAMKLGYRLSKMALTERLGVVKCLSRYFMYRPWDTLYPSFIAEEDASVVSKMKPEVVSSTKNFCLDARPDKFTTSDSI